jgi:hypothetical protein
MSIRAQLADPGRNQRPRGKNDKSDEPEKGVARTNKPWPLGGSSATHSDTYAYQWASAALEIVCVANFA